MAVEPIEIQVGANLIPLMGDDNHQIMDRIAAFRKQVALDMGFVFPKVRVKDDKKLAPNSYRIKIYNAAVADGEIVPDRILAIDPGNTSEKISGVETKDPTYGLPALWILEEQRVQAG